MPFLFIYILKLSVSLAVVFLFYHFALRKLTFYNWNRWYLLGYSLLSFYIPFIDISKVLQQNDWTQNSLVQWVPVINKSVEINTATPSYSISTWSIISLLIISGMFIMLFRLLVQFISFLRMMKKAQFISGEGMKLYQVDKNIIPFSFGNSIFINRHLHTEDELQEIICHEFIHVKQKHSLDIIWGEILCIVNWYNPFAWLLKKSIRQNLEFIADNKVVETGVSKKEYQYLLLKVTGNNQYSIATQFNFSSLKKRIAMMNKLKSAKLNLLRFLFILPLLAVILLSFRKRLSDTLKGKRSPARITSVSNTDTIPNIKNFNDKGYYIEIRKNKLKDNPLVIIKDKDEKEVKRLTIDEWNSRMKYYENLYGQLPALPEPPDAPLPPLLPLSQLPPLTPQLEKLPESVTRIEKNVDWVEVWFKDGKKEKETYDFKIPEQKAAFEKKYGNIIPPPPPPPAVSSVSHAPVVVAGAEITPAATPVSNPVTVAGVSIAPVQASVSAPATFGSVRNATSSDASVSAPDIAIASGNVAIADDAGDLITGDEAIVITITKNTTRQELDEFVKQMKAKGVEMSYDEIEYDSKGILVNISGNLKSKTNHSNFVGQGFSKLILALMKKSEKTWFKVSVTDGKE
jgi:beta-lactamase regulating signal transducer with metallopeptidase domain